MKYDGPDGSFAVRPSSKKVDFIIDVARQLLQETQTLRVEFLDHAKDIQKRFESVNLCELPLNKLCDVIESIKHLRLICIMEPPEVPLPSSQRARLLR